MDCFKSSALVVLLAGVAVAADDTWTGFRGQGDGVTAAKALPLTWSPAENIAWKVELHGYGQSSPVVWKDRVVVTTVAGDQRDKGYVAAYDAASGKKLWIHEFEPTQKAKWSMMVSRAAPTPVVDGDAVYAFFEGGDLRALAHDGTLKWSRSLVKDYGEFQMGHGLGSSLAATADAVIVLVDHRGPSYLLAVDKKTGKNLWKTERASRGSWSSPIVGTFGGRQMVIVSSNGTVAAYDARTGRLAWEIEGISGNTIPSAAIAGDYILVGAGIGQKGSDPKAAAKSNCALVLTQKDGQPNAEVAWTAKRASASYATPLAYRGHAYFVNQTGVLYCLDLSTGKEVYSERIDGTCWASPVASGDHIFFFGKNGIATIVKSGPTFEKVATCQLWDDSGPPNAGSPDSGQGKSDLKREGGIDGYQDPILYGVAAVDRAFFVRTGTMLYRIGKQ